MSVAADWKAELCINPFMLKKDGKFYFDLRLVYYVGANAVYYENGNVAYMDEAYIDAHTGRLLTVHRWINEEGYFASDPSKKVPDDYYDQVIVIVPMDTHVNGLLMMSATRRGVALFRG